MTENQKPRFSPCKTCGQFAKFEEPLTKIEPKRKGPITYEGVCHRKHDDLSFTRDFWGCPHHFDAKRRECEDMSECKDMLE